MNNTAKETHATTDRTQSTSSQSSVSKIATDTVIKLQFNPKRKHVIDGIVNALLEAHQNYRLTTLLNSNDELHDANINRLSTITTRRMTHCSPTTLATSISGRQ